MLHTCGACIKGVIHPSQPLPPPHPSHLLVALLIVAAAASDACPSPPTPAAPRVGGWVALDRRAESCCRWRALPSLARPCCWPKRQATILHQARNAGSQGSSSWHSRAGGQAGGRAGRQAGSSRVGHCRFPLARFSIMHAHHACMHACVRACMRACGCVLDGAWAGVLGG